MCAQSQTKTERVCALLILVYGDESFDETTERVCALSGIIGTEFQWADLESKWVARNEGRPFHAKNCESDWGLYQNPDDPENHRKNQELYRDLTILLAQSGLFGYSAVLDLVAARKYFLAAVDLAYYRCFWHVLDAVQEAAARVGDIAKFTFASRVESDFNALTLYGNLRNSLPGWKESLADELSSIRADENPRVQAGDLLARESMKAIDNILGPAKRLPRKSWEALKNTGRFFIEPFSEEYFQSAAADRDVRIGKFSRGTNDYVQWLEKKGRQHNHTNLLVFMGTRKHML